MKRLALCLVLSCSLPVFAGPVVGPKKIAVVGILWPDYPTPPYPIQQAANFVFNEFAPNYEAQSYGLVDIVPGPVIDWIMMPHPLCSMDPTTTPCYYNQFLNPPPTSLEPCDVNPITNARWCIGAGGLTYSLSSGIGYFDAEIRDTVNPLINYADVSHVVIVVHGYGDTAHVMDDGSGQRSIFSAGPLTGMVDASEPQILIHEVGGHALPDLAPFTGGLGHSGNANCWQDPNTGQPKPPGQGTWYPANLCAAQDCYRHTYSDPFDPMAVSQEDFMAQNKVALGWLQPWQVTAAAPGTYTISSIDDHAGGGGQRGLTIDLGNGRFYAIENRASGVYVRYIQPEQGGACASPHHRFILSSTFTTLSFPVGVQFTDPIRGLWFTVYSRSATSATIGYGLIGGGGGHHCPPICQEGPQP